MSRKVEKNVSRQLQKTLSNIQDLAVRTDKHGVAIVQAGAQARQLANKVLALEDRLAQLEGLHVKPGHRGDKPTGDPPW